MNPVDPGMRPVRRGGDCRRMDKLERRRSMNVTMLCIGSTGDVRPYMLLGKELKKRGHTITVASFAPFEQMIREAGLEFFPVAGDVQELMANLMKPGAVGVRYLTQFEKTIRDIAPVLLGDLLRSCEGADAMMCTYFGSLFYSIAEKYNIPCIQTHYCPMDPNDMTPISSAPGLNWGKQWNKASYRLGYLLIGALEKRYLTQWREENGMEQRTIKTRPDYHVKGHIVPVIYAVSPLVMPRPANWDEHIHMSGFWYDEHPEPWTPPQDLVDFMAAGEKPIYIGFGSMVSGNMNKTMTTVLRAVRAANVRAVIGMGWGGGMQNHANSRVYISNYIPHDWLFPRVAAVVHHGGAGTTASGLRNGKPTLVIPFGGDQPFWGNRVHALGCGPKPIPRDRLTVNRLVRGLIDLTSHASYRVAAEELAERMRLEGGVGRAADLVEQEIAAWKAAPDQP